MNPRTIQELLAAREAGLIEACTQTDWTAEESEVIEAAYINGFDQDRIRLAFPVEAAIAAEKLKGLR